MRSGYLKIKSTDTLTDLIFKDKKIEVTPRIVKELIKINRSGGCDVSFIDEVLSQESKNILFGDKINPLTHDELTDDIKGVLINTPFERDVIIDKYSLEVVTQSYFHTLAVISDVDKPVCAELCVLETKKGNRYLSMNLTSSYVDYDLVDEFVSKTFNCKVPVFDSSNLYQIV